MKYTVRVKGNCTLENKIINYRYFYFEIVSLTVFKIETKEKNNKKFRNISKFFGHFIKVLQVEFSDG